LGHQLRTRETKRKFRGKTPENFPSNYNNRRNAAPATGRLEKSFTWDGIRRRQNKATVAKKTPTCKSTDNKTRSHSPLGWVRRKKQRIGLKAIT